MILIICESLREIGEVACVTSAWSSRGQTLNLSFATLYFTVFRLAVKKLSDFFFLNWFLRVSFAFYFPVFSQMLSVIVKEWKFCCIGLQVKN